MSSFFFDYLFPLKRINGKNRYEMEEDIDQIEQFLRGRMSQKEEDVLKIALTTDTRLRSYAFIVTNLLRKQKFG